MLSTLRNVWAIGDLRRKLLFVFAMLFIYKVGTHIPVPGINREVIRDLGQDGSILSLANIIGGGALQNFSIFAVGIMPYITAAIVIQLLQMDVVQKLKEWSEQGEHGQKKIKVLTRYLTVVFAFIQSIAMTFGFNQMYPGLIPNPSFGSYALIIFVLTMGTVVLMIMGEMIDKKGIGRGMSILITAGILVSLPSVLSMYYMTEFENVGDAMSIAIIKTILLLILVVVITIGIIYVHKGERRLTVQYTRGGNQKSSTMAPQKNHIPIKLNPAGVIPVIFAMALIMMPMTIGEFSDHEIANWIQRNMSFQEPLGMLFYGAFIFFFTYFYAFVQVNPEKMTKNLQQSGGYLPGIRPGEETQKYITKVLKRMTFVGGVFLTMVAIVPSIIGGAVNLPEHIQVGGISLIIVVNVALDTLQRIEAQMVQRKYTGFLGRK